MIRFLLNGSPQEVDVENEMPLLWVLREELGLRGTKFGCGAGLCGACTVHLDGRAVRSCVTPVSVAENRTVTTIEGLGTADNPHPIQEAWVEHQVPQCGYCQPGMQMSCAAILAAKGTPTDADIDAGVTNLCRCGCYGGIRAAIHTAAAAMAEGE